jgi:hypothetical protein
MSRWLGSDREASVSFEEFVQGCSPRQFRTALLLAGHDRAAAEDLLQLALERAYRHWGRVCREIAITPDGKTAYVLGVHTVTPINTATNTPGKPIRLGSNPTALIAITPDGKTAYVGTTGTVIPISTATNTPGKPIRIGAGVPAEEMVFTPDSKTAYVANEEGPTGRVIPISTATSTPGKPIRIGVGTVIAITPDGKTVYAAAQNKVVPISTATNTPGKPIRLSDGLPTWIVATP